MPGKSALFATVLGLLCIIVPSLGIAAEVGDFDLLGFKLRSTPQEIESAAGKNGFAIAGREFGPSFSQTVAQKRGQRVPAASYATVLKLHLVRSDARLEVFFVPDCGGEVSYQILANVYEVPKSKDLDDLLTSRYGRPDYRNENRWIWGDTEAFYRRNEVSLEAHINPPSATSTKPTIRLVLAKPDLRTDAISQISKAAKGQSLSFSPGCSDTGHSNSSLGKSK